MTKSHLLIGKIGEDIACNYLLSKGYKILERNFRVGNYGEIDIICQKGNFTVFIEVKTRTSNIKGEGDESINTKKLASLNRVCSIYQEEHPNIKPSLLLDALVIMLNPINHSDYKITHYENLDIEGK